MKTNILKKDSSLEQKQTNNTISCGVEKINGMTVVKFNGIMDGPGGALGVKSYTVIDNNGNLAQMFI